MSKVYYELEPTSVDDLISQELTTLVKTEDGGLKQVKIIRIFLKSGSHHDEIIHTVLV